MVSVCNDKSRAPLVLLSGGGGGARLAAALSKCTVQRPVIVVTNTGDDFEHLGLLICPDTDSVLYATSGKLDRARGWGREGESWQVLDAIQGMAGPSWFQLGDKDLALHLLRAEQLRKGSDLAAVTQVLSERLGVPGGTTVIPATEQSVRTRVVTEEGELAFQEYFVGQRCEPVLHDVLYEGIEHA
ncbi:MAG: 2-phospho-L-lactate transferase CofD family protein, partial [Halieaceae bacterium]